MYYYYKNPVFVPVSRSFVRAPAHLGYPGSKGCKTVVVVVVNTKTVTVKISSKAHYVNLYQRLVHPTKAHSDNRNTLSMDSTHM